MHAFKLLISIALSAVTVLADNAPEVTDNPPAAWYIADFPDGGQNTVVAQILVNAAKDGPGCAYVMNVNGVVSTPGPYGMSSLQTKSLFVLFIETWWF